MRKGEKRKQQKALKRRSEAKKARKRAHAQWLVPPLQLLQARSYPLEGCWVQEDWRENGLAVVVARRQPNGCIVFGNYLVDYYCLGLKSTYCNVDILPDRFHRELLPKMISSAGRPQSISAGLAHELIYGAIEYAAQFGFRPERDYRLSRYVLDPPEMHPRTGKVEFGKEGKPFFVNGPHDDVDAVVSQLLRTAGEGNFDYLVGIDPGELVLDE